MTDNRKEADGWLDQVTTALIDGTTDTITPMVAAAGITHALLDIADAIRELETPSLGGIRDDLQDIAHAARRPRG